MKLRLGHDTGNVDNLLELCASITLDPDIHRALNRLRLALARGALDRSASRAMKDALEQARDTLLGGQDALAQVHLRRAIDVAESTAADSVERGTKMGIFDKLKRTISQGNDQKKVLAKPLKETKDSIYSLQQTIEKLSAQKEALLAEMHALADKCKTVQNGSTEFANLRARALTLEPQIKMLDQTLSKYRKVLAQKSHYLGMLNTADINKELTQHLTNIAQAEVVEEIIRDDTLQIDEGIEEFSGVMDRFQQNFMNSIGDDAEASDSMFDQMLANARDDGGGQEQSLFDRMVAEAQQPPAAQPAKAAAAPADSVSGQKLQFDIPTLPTEEEQI